MMHDRKKLPTLAAATLLALFAAQANAQAVGDIRIEFTNNLAADGFFMTPVWFGFHDGATPDTPGDNTFDLFDNGSPATLGLEELAEDGLLANLQAEFTAAGIPGDQQGVVLGPQGFAGAPVIDPGETGVAFITPINPARYQFITLASMIIPSNDNFIGNGNPDAWQIFNEDGSLNDAADGTVDGFVTIQLLGSSVYDAGTELNNDQGAAFSTTGGTATDTTDGVSLADLTELQAVFGGTSTPAGTTIGSFFGASDVIATLRVSVVPEPATGLVGLPAVALLSLYRRRKSS